MSQKSSGISRRGVLAGSAGAAAAAVLSGTLTPPAQAAAPMMGGSRPNHYRFTLGDFEITTLWDGGTKLAGPFPIFGYDQFEEDVQELAEANFLPKSRMEISYTPVMVNTGKQLILFDSGNGDIRRAAGAGRLIKGLARAGFTPEQIDVIAITHCHPDHIGGLMENGKAIFPNARYLVGGSEYDFWSDPDAGSADPPIARRAQIVQQKLVPLREKISFLKSEGEVISGINAIPCFGHTPGHLGFHIESKGKRLMLWGDAIIHHVVSLQQPEWHVSTDMDRDGAAETRKKLLDMTATERMPAIGYHMPFPAIGFVERKGEGYRWVPASYQFDL